MWWIVLAVTMVVVLAAGGVGLWFWQRRREQQRIERGHWPYRRRRPLGDLEQAVFFSLLEGLPEHIILSQVSLSKLCFVRGAEAQQWQRRIHDLSADFVVCDRSFRTVAVIDLEDGFEDEIERTEADIRKEKALLDAGFRLFRWNTFNLPTTEQMRNAIVGLTLAVDTKRPPLLPLEPLEPFEPRER